MAARVGTPSKELNTAQPKMVETTKNKFEYLCLNATKAYFKKVTSENNTCTTVIAKIALLAIPIIAALVVLEAAFDLLIAPITFIANCIAGPQKILEEVPVRNIEDSNKLPEKTPSNNTGEPTIAVDDTKNPDLPPAPITPKEEVKNLEKVLEEVPIRNREDSNKLSEKTPSNNTGESTLDETVFDLASRTSLPEEADNVVTPAINNEKAAEPVPTPLPAKNETEINPKKRPRDVQKSKDDLSVNDRPKQELDPKIKKNFICDSVIDNGSLDKILSLNSRFFNTSILQKTLLAQRTSTLVMPEKTAEQPTSTASTLSTPVTPEKIAEQPASADPTPSTPVMLEKTAEQPASAAPTPSTPVMPERTAEQQASIPPAPLSKNASKNAKKRLARSLHTLAPPRQGTPMKPQQQKTNNKLGKWVNK